jgi:hypothetical protein
MAIRFIENRIFRLLILAGVSIWLRQLDYLRHEPDFTFCLFHRLTGLNCYGCGFLRGIAACMHMDWDAVWALNKMNVITIPLIGWITWYEFLRIEQKDYEPNK